jgi:hypothetical protein
MVTARSKPVDAVKFNPDERGGMSDFLVHLHVIEIPNEAPVDFNAR